MEDNIKMGIFLNSVQILIRGAQEINGGLDLNEILIALESLVEDYKEKLENKKI